MKRAMCITLICLFILPLTGCRSIQEAQRKKEIALEMPMRMGWTEDEIIREMGAPTKIDRAGSYLIYTYFSDYGSSGLVYRGIVSTHSKTDAIRVYFQDGKSVDWDCKVSR